MNFFNTLSGQKEHFTVTGGKVRMYVCGVTPYGQSHIGHAMCSVVFDVVRRYLEFKGYEVLHIQNFTDIDDKMIQAAAEASISIGDLADRNIRSYLEEMDALNVLRAHSYPRATEEMPKILEMIEYMVEQGFAYVVDGDVYFRVMNYRNYGKLSHQSLEAIQVGARVEINENKEDPTDFVLWKSKKPGEPAWDSPWGPGRPGWHIECSAMSLAYLGETIDIHGGGQDLIFPHHENELAQTESYTGGKEFVRFWLHNGLLRLGEDKMSKSIGNLVTVQESLNRYSSDAIRLFILGSHYRSPIVYSDRNIEPQERAAERLRNALKPVEDSKAKTLLDVRPFRDRFIEAMDDDLNVPKALASLFDLARCINRGCEKGRNVIEAQGVLRSLAGVLGLTLEDTGLLVNQNVAPIVDLLLEIRSDLRSAKLYDLADKVRLRLDDLGIGIEDTASGTKWKQKAK